MNDLVILKKDDVFTTSKVIADGTGVAHRKLKVTINKYKSVIESFGLLTSYQAESTGGRPEEIILLTEEQATFLITLLKNTDKVVMFKAELVRQFFEMRKFIMERHTAEWVESRKQSKLNRKTQTDAIKELVEYAQANGSKNSNRYYAIYSRLADKVVGIQNRNEAHISQLNTLSVVEAVMGSTIHECIANGMEYHEIYKVCQKKLEVFSNIMYLEKVS
ncbi:MAG: Rha family transcriptional regulator [Ruminococcus sp.]|nr:Rha family transcriptional regulator [Ruminococcus sp.]